MGRFRGFHATIDEITERLKSIMQDYNLIVIVAKLWPEFEFEIVDKSTLENKIDYGRFVFLYKEIPNQLSKDYWEFREQNAENIELQIGIRTEDGLIESRIGAAATDPETVKLWNKVIRAFRKGMYKGIWIINICDGAKGYYKDHYFTAGAKNEYEKGIIMKPFVNSLTEYLLTQEHE